MILMHIAEHLGTFPILRTERLILRNATIDDAQDLVGYFSNPNVYKHMEPGGPITLEKAVEAISTWDVEYIKGENIRFAIAEPKTNKMIGSIFLLDFFGRGSELVFDLDENYWRKGYMTEAINEIIEFAFYKLNRIRIQACVYKENYASQDLLKKLGFQREGLLRKVMLNEYTGSYEDLYIYSLLDTDPR